jgi:hypothetical protein
MDLVGLLAGSWPYYTDDGVLQPLYSLNDIIYIDSRRQLRATDGRATEILALFAQRRGWCHYFCKAQVSHIMAHAHAHTILPHLNSQQSWFDPGTSSLYVVSTHTYLHTF